MRTELEKIQIIEQYLEGKLSDEEKLGFEQEMAADKELASEVKFQSVMILGLNEDSLKKEMEQEYILYKKEQKKKLVIYLICFVALLFVSRECKLNSVWV